MINYTIAITGGIGSGKSTVSSLIKNLGFQVYSADEIYNDLIKQPKIVNDICNLLGLETKFDIDGKPALDKKAVACVVFENKEAFQKLNAYNQKIVYDEIKQICNTQENQILFFEIPLLFETSMQGEFDDVIVVMRNIEDRINAVIQRNNITREEVIARMNNQFNYDNLLPTLHKVIYNDSDVSALSEKVGRVDEAIKKEAFANL